MATWPLGQRLAGTAESAAGTEELRSSAAFPLPRMRPVADFVALPATKRYVSVQGKFSIALGAGAAWLVVALAAAWWVVPALGGVVGWPIAVPLYLVVVAMPGALEAFTVAGIALDRPPTPAVAHPTLPVTVAITSHNQPRTIVSTLQWIRVQDYDGPLTVLLVDSGSTDSTVDEARRAAVSLGLELRIVVERRPGVVHARNAATACAETPLLALVEAGALLHPSAIRMLVARLLRSPADTAAVSAHVLVRNHRNGRLAEAVAHGYSLSVHASQRLHGLFQAPLVAEGACSLYRTDAVRAVGGWTRDDADGVTLAWQFLERGWHVFHEPLAVAFTTWSVRAGSWSARRIRAAQTIVEAARRNGIGALRFPFNRFVAFTDAAAPLTDGVFAGGALLALALALSGAPALVVAYGVLVLPVSILEAVVARRAARRVMDDVGLRVSGGPVSWLASATGLHCVQAPLGAGNALAHAFGRVADS